MGDRKLLDHRIRAALTNSRKKHKSQLIPLGPLQGFSCLFAFEFDDTSLHQLGALRARTRSESAAKTDPRMQVLLGVGLQFQGQLYTFFNTMLEFHNEQIFEAFLSRGYSLVITGGTHQNIVAAVTFIVSTDGLFIDAIAVSHGRGTGVCKLKSDTLIGADDAQKSLIRQSEGGSFQKLGLGNFLLALVSHCASLECTHKRASVLLKSNSCIVDFYFKRGFTTVPPATSVPAELLKIVPRKHYATNPPETSLLSNPVKDFLVRLRGGAPKVPTLTPRAQMSPQKPPSVPGVASLPGRWSLRKQKSSRH